MKGSESTFKGKKHTVDAIEKISKSQIGNNKGSKWVLDTLTGVFYQSASEVARLYGLKEFTLRNKLNGFRSNNTKFIYA